MGINESTTFNQTKFYSEWIMADQLHNNHLVWKNKLNPNFQLEQFTIFGYSDDDVTRFRALYELRKNSSELVMAYYMKQVQKSGLCTAGVQGKLYIQKISIRLSQLQHVPYPDSLHLMFTALAGYRKIVREVGVFKVQQSQIGFTQNGEAKVWLNTDFSSITPSIMQHSQQSMVHGIIQLIQDNVDHDTVPKQIPSLSEYILQRKEGGDKIGFDQALVRVREYANKFNDGILPKSMECIRQVGVGKILKNLQGTQKNRVKVNNGKRIEGNSSVWKSDVVQYGLVNSGGFNGKSNNKLGLNRVTLTTNQPTDYLGTLKKVQSLGQQSIRSSPTSLINPLPQHISYLSPRNTITPISLPSPNPHASFQASHNNNTQLNNSKKPQYEMKHSMSYKELTNNKNVVFSNNMAVNSIKAPNFSSSHINVPANQLIKQSIRTLHSPRQFISRQPIIVQRPTMIVPGQQHLTYSSTNNTTGKQVIINQTISEPIVFQNHLISQPVKQQFYPPAINNLVHRVVKPYPLVAQPHQNSQSTPNINHKQALISKAEQVPQKVQKQHLQVKNNEHQQQQIVVVDIEPPQSPVNTLQQAEYLPQQFLCYQQLQLQIQLQQPQDHSYQQQSQSDHNLLRNNSSQLCHQQHHQHILHSQQQAMMSGQNIEDYADVFNSQEEKNEQEQNTQQQQYDQEQQQEQQLINELQQKYQYDQQQYQHRQQQNYPVEYTYQESHELTQPQQFYSQDHHQQDQQNPQVKMTQDINIVQSIPQAQRQFTQSTPILSTQSSPQRKSYNAIQSNTISIQITKTVPKTIISTNQPQQTNNHTQSTINYEPQSMNNHKQIDLMNSPIISFYKKDSTYVDSQMCENTLVAVSQERQSRIDQQQYEIELHLQEQYYENQYYYRENMNANNIASHLIDSQSYKQQLYHNESTPGSTIKSNYQEVINEHQLIQQQQNDNKQHYLPYQQYHPQQQQPQQQKQQKYSLDQYFDRTLNFNRQTYSNNYTNKSQNSVYNLNHNQITPNYNSTNNYTHLQTTLINNSSKQNTRDINLQDGKSPSYLMQQIRKITSNKAISTTYQNNNNNLTKQKDSINTNDYNVGNNSYTSSSFDSKTLNHDNYNYNYKYGQNINNQSQLTANNFSRAVDNQYKNQFSQKFNTNHLKFQTSYQPQNYQLISDNSEQYHVDYDPQILADILKLSHDIQKLAQ